MKRLKKAGKSRTEIAVGLKEAGYLTPTSGKAATNATVSAMLLRSKKNIKAKKLTAKKMAPPNKPKLNSIIKGILKETSVPADDRIIAALALLG